MGADTLFSSTFFSPTPLPTHPSTPAKIQAFFDDAAAPSPRAPFIVAGLEVVAPDGTAMRSARDVPFSAALAASPAGSSLRAVIKARSGASLPPQGEGRPRGAAVTARHGGGGGGASAPPPRPPPPQPAVAVPSAAATMAAQPPPRSNGAAAGVTPAGGLLPLHKKPIKPTPVRLAPGLVAPEPAASASAAPGLASRAAAAPAAASSAAPSAPPPPAQSPDGVLRLHRPP